MNHYPDLEVELVLDDKPAELVGENIDIAVRCGPLQSSGLIARYVSDLPHTVVCTPGYLKGRQEPRHPHQLVSHQCIRSGFHTDAGKWQFVEQGKAFAVPVTGKLRVNGSQAIIQATKQHLGIALLPRYQVASELEAGVFRELLSDFMPPATPVYLVYTHRQHMSAAVKTCLEFLQELL